MFSKLFCVSIISIIFPLFSKLFCLIFDNHYYWGIESYGKSQIAKNSKEQPGRWQNTHLIQLCKSENSSTRKRREKLSRALTWCIWCPKWENTYLPFIFEISIWDNFAVGGMKNFVTGLSHSLKTWIYTLCKLWKDQDNFLKVWRNIYICRRSVTTFSGWAFTNKVQWISVARKPKEGLCGLEI